MKKKRQAIKQGVEESEIQVEQSSGHRLLLCCFKAHSSFFPRLGFAIIIIFFSFFFVTQLPPLAPREPPRISAGRDGIEPDWNAFISTALYQPTFDTPRRRLLTQTVQFQSAQTHAGTASVILSIDASANLQPCLRVGQPPLRRRWR